MDLATILGLALAWGALFLSLLLEGGKINELINIPAFVLVVFGTIGATITGTSMKTLTSIPLIVGSAIKNAAMDPAGIIETMVDFARKARREGILALEAASQEVDNDFLRKGVMLIVDGTPSVMVREILETEVVGMQERHKLGETVFTSLGGFSPTLGIIGTVMGLINMLARLSEPGKMGHAIASAFIATLYGVSLANLVYLPIASKLKANTAEEVVCCEMIIEGVLSIQAGDNARIVETRMMAFLPPKLRETIEQSRSEGGREEAMAA
jgi:chemotaxis protein MotA